MPLVVVLGLLFGGSLTLGVVSASQARAVTSMCSGFAACETAPYTDHGWGGHYTDTFSGGWGYWSQVSGHNCTNYVAYYEQAVNGVPAARPSWLGSGNADAWASEAAGGGVTVSSTPVVGAIAQWGDYGWNGNAGHVGIVESVFDNGATVAVSWDSYPSGPYKWVSLNSSDANTSTAVGWPSGFIYAGGVGSSGGSSPYVVSTPKPVAYTVGGTSYIDVYAVASDHNIYRNTWNGISWTTASTSTGCCFERNPSVVTYQVGGTSYIDLYATASNSNIYRNTWNGSSWTGFTYLGCCFWSDPTAVSYTVGGTAYVDVYATASNLHMFRDTWNGSSWSGFLDLGCCFTNHAPTAVVYNVGSTAHIDLYNTASDSHIYRNAWNGSTWSGFTNVGCCFVSDPAAVAYAVASLPYVDVYANASNGHMYRNTWNGSSWNSSFADMGCCFTSHAPTAATYSIGSTAYIDLYNTASNYSVYFNRWNGSTWNSGFTAFGCCFESDPTAVVSTVGGTQQVYVFAVASDQALYYYVWDGTAWSSPSRRIACCFEHLSS